MRKIPIVLGFMLLSTVAAGAQTLQPSTLTLQQAVSRVQSVGFDVRIARADALVASADAGSARASLRPHIELTGNVLDANEPQLGMPVARQEYAAATLSVPISSRANALSARAAGETARAAQTSTFAAKNDAVLAAVQAYRRVQLGDAILDARRAAVVDQQTHLRLTEQRVAAGKAARYLTLRDRASLANALQAQEDAASERDQAAYDLEALLDLGQDPLAIDPLTLAVLGDTHEAVLGRALRQQPSLLAAEDRVAAAQTGIAAARAASHPTTMLTAQSYNGSSSPLLGRSGGQVELSASLPLLDGGSRAAGTARAQAQYDRAVAARDQARAGVLRDVAIAWREYDAASRNLATATAVQSDAEEQLRLATLRQNAGKAIEVEVLDALSTAANAREAVARSIARYDVAIASVHHAAGDTSP